jgi:hypothetical protein
MIGVLDVARNNDGLLPASVTSRSVSPRVVVLFQIGDQDIGSLPGEGNGDGAADALSPPVMTAFLPLEPAAALVGSFAVVGQRIHRACRAGHRLMLAREGWAWIMQAWCFSERRALTPRIRGVARRNVEVNVQPGPSFLRANRAVRPGRPQWQERCDTHRAWFSQKRESDVTI